MTELRLSFWQISNMSFGFLGIQFGWGLQMANMSAIYEYLGAKPEQIPIRVFKVEPPGWWPGHTLNPVRLLVRGRNLGGARVEAPAGAGLDDGVRLEDRLGSAVRAQVQAGRFHVSLPGASSVVFTAP